MRNTLKNLVFILASACVAIGQTQKTGTAVANGTCNLANTGNNNSNIRIDCGIGKEQGKKIIDLLNKVLANQDRNAKLDELLKVASQPVQIVNAPNGIGTIGGTLVNPTVNNFAPPSRHIPESIRPDLIDCLSKHPGTVEIMAPVNDAESFALATEWLDVFDKAKWSIDPKMVRSYMSSGAVPTGTKLNINGTINPDGTNPKFDPDSPSGSLVGCFLGKPSDGSSNLVPSPTVAKDHIGVVVGPRPPS
jgi:hypothetical protein